MKTDSMRMGMAYRKLRIASQNCKSFELHKLHYVQPQEEYDPSLTQQLVYQNRADWLVAAASCGLNDVDLAAEQGARRFIPLSRAAAITQATAPVKRKSGMKLY